MRDASSQSHGSKPHEVVSHVSNQAKNHPLIHRMRFGLVGVLALFVAPLAAYAVSGSSDTNSVIEMTAVDDTSSNSQNDTSIETRLNNDSSNRGYSRSETKVDIHAESNSKDSPRTNNRVEVNGKQVPVPKDGVVERRIKDSSGDTNVKIESYERSVRTSGESTTETSINVRSSTESEEQVDNEEVR